MAYYREGVSPKEIDIGAMVEESVKVYDSKFAPTSIQLRMKIDEGNCILGFPDEIWQVSDNLLLNAVEAMPAAAG